MQEPLISPHNHSQRRIPPFILWTALAVAGAFLISRIPNTTTIFALATLIAFGAAPVTKKLEQRMPRSVAIGIVYISLILALSVLILLVVPATIAQAQVVLASAPEVAQKLQAGAQELDHRLQGRLGPSYAVGIEQVRSMLVNRIDTWTSVALGSLTAIVVQTFTALFILLSAIVLSAFFLSRAEAIGASFRSLFPPARRHLAAEFEHELARVFGGFVAGQVTLCVVTAVAVWSCLSILNVPFAIIAGVATGIGYAIPFIGMFVVQIAVALLALPEGWTTVVRVTIAIFAIARIVDTFLVPKVMSESVGVSPIAVMFAVFAGGEVFGIGGLVLGIPAAALAKTLWNVFLRARAENRLIVENEADLNL